MGRRLVRALRQRDRLLHPDAADRPHLHLAARRGSRRCRSGASPTCTLLGCIPWVLALALIGAGGRRELGRVARHTSTTSTTSSSSLSIAADRLPADPAAARRGGAAPDRDAGRALGATERLTAHPGRPGAGARSRPGAGRAAAGLQLRPHRPRPLARRLGLGRARPRGPQELRGRPPCRRRGGAADRPAAADRRGAARASTLRRALLLGLSFLPAAVVGYTLERPIEQRLGRAAGDGARAARRRRGDACRRPAAAGAGTRATRPRPTGWPRHRPGGGARRRASRATGSPSPPPAGAASRATRPTSSRGRSRCRSSSAPASSRGCGCGAAAPLPSCGASMAVGVGASFASTLASQRLIGLVERDRALWPYAVYRAGLAAGGSSRSCG